MPPEKATVLSKIHSTREWTFLFICVICSICPKIKIPKCVMLFKRVIFKLIYLSTSIYHLSVYIPSTHHLYSYNIVSLLNWQGISVPVFLEAQSSLECWPSGLDFNSHPPLLVMRSQAWNGKGMWFSNLPILMFPRIESSPVRPFIKGKLQVTEHVH